MTKYFWNQIIFLLAIFLGTLSNTLSSLGEEVAIPITIKNKEGVPVISYKNSRALIIWVGNYKKWPKLQHVREEAQQVKEALENQGFLVKVTEGSTAQDIKSSLDAFTAEYAYRDDVDRVVIFLTGHGISRNGKGFFIAADSPGPKFFTTLGTDTDFFKKTVPMERFYQEISTLYTAKHILIVLDTCFSGSIFRQKSNLNTVNTFVESINHPSRQVITAGSDREEVPAKSIFTPLFIEALEGAADSNQDGVVTGSEIASYLIAQVPAKASPPNSQTPQYAFIRPEESSGMNGNIVFGKVKASILFTLTPQTAPDLKPSELVSKRRSSYVVEYFGQGKVNDSNHVENVLHKLGFVKAKLPSQNKTLISDSIWVGGQVDIEDIKVLAYTLIQDGIPLKSIRTFRKTQRHPNPERLKLIQIGADKDLPSNCKPLTIRQIQTVTQIDRTTLVCGN